MNYTNNLFVFSSFLSFNLCLFQNVFFSLIVEIKLNVLSAKIQHSFRHMAFKIVYLLLLCMFVYICVLCVCEK